MKYVADAVNTLGGATIHDREDLLLGLGAEFLRTTGLLIGVFEDLCARRDQFSKNCLLRNDIRVVNGVSSVGNGCGEFRQVGCAPYLLVFSCGTEFGDQQGDVNFFSGVMHLSECFVNLAIRIIIKIIRPQRSNFIRDLWKK